MDDHRQPLFLPLTPGPWTYDYRESQWRVCAGRESPRETVAIADLIQPSQANAALIAAAPRMLDLLLRWIRAGDARDKKLQHEARVLVTELEAASATWVTMGLRHHAGSVHDVAAPPTSERREALSRTNTVVLIVDDDPKSK
jgi:hypothetical protein